MYMLLLNQSSNFVMVVVVMLLKLFMLLLVLQLDTANSIHENDIQFNSIHLNRYLEMAQDIHNRMVWQLVSVFGSTVTKLFDYSIVQIQRYYMITTFTIRIKFNLLAFVLVERCVYFIRPQ